MSAGSVDHANLPTSCDVEREFLLPDLDLDQADTEWLRAPLVMLVAHERSPVYVVTLLGGTLISLVCFVLLALAAAQR